MSEVAANSKAFNHIQWLPIGFQRVLEEFSANMRTCGGGGKIKGDANQASHKLERGCQLGFKEFHRFLQ